MWADVICQRLNERDAQEHAFAGIVASFNRLQEKLEYTREKNMHLKVENDKLKNELSQKLGSADSGSRSLGSISAQMVEQKLLGLQERELEFLREKDRLNTQLNSLLNDLHEKDRLNTQLSSQLSDLHEKERELQEEIERLRLELEQLKETNQTLTDELQANQLAYNQLEGNFKKIVDENTELIQRWMEHKGKLATRVNRQNEEALRRQQEKVRRELEEAAKEQVNIRADAGDCLPQPEACGVVSVPRRLQSELEAHDGEVNGCRWSPSGRLLATAGTDRKVKLWASVAGRLESRGVLSGSNASVNGVSFDAEEQLLAAPSNDYAVRVWSLGDQRMRACLTGHSNKALACCFFSSGQRLVSGSHDRTLKLWDLRSRACVRTVFAGSSCNDLLVSPALHDLVASGHFDKKVRLYDCRGEAGAGELPMSARVTGLDADAGGQLLLVATRDDQLCVVDLRARRVLRELRADGFRVGLDSARCCFSPDAQFAAAGSEHGQLFVWHTATGRLEARLDAQHDATVIGVGWHPAGAGVASCDRNRRVCVWQ